MSDLLKGNFKTRKAVADETTPPSLEDQFELAALKRLGGSITFVAKRRIMWDLKTPPDESGQK